MKDPNRFGRIGRYTIVRGRRLPRHGPYPTTGIRIDTRAHTLNFLAPEKRAVMRALSNPGEAARDLFAREYAAALRDRFASNRSAFDGLVARCMQSTVWIGCSCPTVKQPNVMHCHTVLAIAFMQRMYPNQVRAEWPGPISDPGIIKACEIVGLSLNQ